MSTSEKVEKVPQLDERKIAEYQATFTLFDRNCNGRIEIKEIGTILRSLGYNPTLSQVHELIEFVDDGSGTIEFEDFLKVMNKKNIEALEKVSLEEVSEALEIFDKESTQWLDSTALRDIVTKLGESLTQEEADELLLLTDPDNSGSINLKEFAEMIMKK